MGAKKSSWSARSTFVLGALLLTTVFALTPGLAGADNGPVTFTATKTFPVPPASNYAGTGGGDGWAVALSPRAVYNVFHHQSTLDVACHFQVAQTDAQGNVVHNAGDTCFGDVGSKTIVIGDHNFASSGQPGLYLDQATQKLYIYATRDDGTGGVVCFDTTTAAPCAGDAAFLPLTPQGDSSLWPGWGEITDPVVVGSKWFAFNYFPDSGVSGARNTLLCFDLKTLSACAGQPYTVDLRIGDATMAELGPSPAIAAIGGELVIPVATGQTGELACFDALAADLTNPDQTACGGSWPVPVAGYVGQYGAPFPMLDGAGAVTGFCLPNGTDPCYDLSGNSVATPAGMTSAVPGTSGWNGNAVAIGPRVYVPNGNSDAVDCYDYAAGAGCSSFPRTFTNLGLLYTVNTDPQRPTCLWVNADNGTQIQNFDAFTGGACGEGPIRVLAESFVASPPKCFPGQFTSLQVVSPAPGSYSDGSIQFADASGNPVPGSAPIALDATGTGDLRSLALSSDQALPQFLVTLNGAGERPQEVTVTLTWTGTYDQACAGDGTTIVNPPVENPPPSNPPPSNPPPSNPPPSGSQPQPNVAVSVSGPPVGRVGQNVVFTATVSNTSGAFSTGTYLRATVPSGAALVSSSSSRGSCSGTTAVVCSLGTLAPGASATGTFTVRASQPRTLTLTAGVSGDNDSNPGDNTASASTPVVAQNAPPPAPPAPTTPGTYNALSTGTVLVNGVAVPADRLFVIKAGDTVDVTDGVITFTTVDGSVGTFSNSPPAVPRRAAALGGLARPAASGSVSQFVVSDDPDATRLTLTGGDFSACTAPRKLDSLSPGRKDPKPTGKHDKGGKQGKQAGKAKPRNKTVVRQLWGKAKGHFRTGARFSAATIRGTVWGVEDRCDGTLTTALVDSVDVQDLVLNKTITLNPGQSYLAQPRQPAGSASGRGASQTAATVQKNGLHWAGRVFLTKKAFAGWLSGKGASWAAFAQKRPGLAKSLAARGG